MGNMGMEAGEVAQGHPAQDTVELGFQPDSLDFPLALSTIC